MQQATYFYADMRPSDDAIRRRCTVLHLKGGKVVKGERGTKSQRQDTEMQKKQQQQQSLHPRKRRRIQASDHDGSTDCTGRNANTGCAAAAGTAAAAASAEIATTQRITAPIPPRWKKQLSNQLTSVAGGCTVVDVGGVGGAGHSFQGESTNPTPLYSQYAIKDLPKQYPQCRKLWITSCGYAGLPSHSDES